MINGDSAAAVDFLRHWEPDGPWVLTAIIPDGATETRTFARDDGIFRWIEDRQGKKNIYFSVNRPKAAKDKKLGKADIGAMKALHVDCDPVDGLDINAERGRIERALRSFDPAPSVILFSGGGLQGFWLFDKPIEVGTGDIERLESYNRRIEEDLSSDHCHNIDRIMRLPGTLNIPGKRKLAKGRQVELARVVAADWKQRYKLEQFRQAVSPEAPKIVVGNGSPRLKRDLPIRVADVVRSGAAGDWGGDRSAAVFFVCCQMVRCGWNDVEIAEAITNAANGISAHVRDQPRPAEYAARQVSRARDKAGNDPPPAPSIAAVYDYRDVEGVIAYQVVRMVPKAFYKRHPDGRGGWENGLKLADDRVITQVPYRLPEIREYPNSTIIVVEGEKHADRLSDMGFTATCNTGGGVEGWKAEITPWFSGRRVAVVPNNNLDGVRFMNDVARKLSRVAGEVRWLVLPNVNEGGNISDWLDSGGTEGELEKLINSAPLWEDPGPQEAPENTGAKILDFPRQRRRKPRPPDAGGEGKPTIQIVPGGIRKMVDEAEAAMLAMPSGCGIYRFGSALVRIVIDEIKVSGNRTDKALRNSVVNVSYLYEIFSAAARWVKWDKKAGKWVGPADPPMRVAEVYLARDGDWEVPPLMGVITAPILRPDGSLLDKPGYDEATGLVFDPCGIEFLPVSANPTKAEAKRALKLLKKPIRLYKFEDDEIGRAVAISGVMTAVLRRAMPTAPMHIFDGNAPGVGKSALVDYASIVGGGHRAAVINGPKNRRGNEEELEKKLTGACLGGDQIITLDNMEDPIGSPLLNQMCTQHTLRLRPFHTLNMVTVPIMAAIFGTGNNVTIIGDMIRRALCARVITDSEHPEEIKYPFDPVKLALRARRYLVWAVLTIARAWLVARRRSDLRLTLGSFEEWCVFVREPLVWLGMADPCKSLERVRTADPKMSVLRDMIAHWLEWRGEDTSYGVTTRQIIDAANEKYPADEHGEQGSLKRIGFFDVLQAATEGRKETISPNSLGWYLRNNADRVVTIDGRSYRIAQRANSDARKASSWALDELL